MSPVQKRFSFATRLKSKFSSSSGTVPTLSSATPNDGEPPLATLRVQVIACRNLHSADANGKSDPYVSVSFQRQKKKTPVIQKTLDPHWPAKDATFDFPLYKSVAERLGTLLEIVVWDKDFVGKDYLGEVSLPASRWFERNAGGMNFERAESFWVDLDLQSSRTKHKAASGSVHLRIGFVHPTNTVANFQSVYNDLCQVGGGLAELFSAPATAGVGTVLSDTKDAVVSVNPPGYDQSTESHAPSPTFRINWEGTLLAYSFTQAPPLGGVLLLEVRRATDLPKQKHFAKQGWDMDPFVLVGSSSRTRVIRHSVQPHWDERLALSVRPDERVRLRVMDWDRFSADDTVGEAWLDVASLTGDGLQEVTLPLAVDFEGSGFDPKSTPNGARLVLAAKYESHDALRRRFFAHQLKNAERVDAHALAVFVEQQMGVSRAEQIARLVGARDISRDEAVDVLLQLFGSTEVESPTEAAQAESVYETADDATPRASVSPVEEAPAPADQPRDEAAAAVVVPAPAMTDSTEQPNGAEQLSSTEKSDVTFEIAGHALTTWGDHIYVVGDIPELGSWDPDRAIKLSSAKYPLWTAAVVLPADTTFEYKYIRKTPGQPVAWEEPPYLNRTAKTPSDGNLRVHDAWY
ncbi:hypothetical protein AURDEDRAFT_115297 [Auricularia subglabra TFB-10046 SS5]|nr:hypothetical protein AURDEDRAFT_115297 [Auricularia subglabra TFB-10046 SS5]